MGDPTAPLRVIGPATPEPGIAGGAMHTFAAFLTEARRAGVGLEVVDTGAASVPSLLRRSYKAWVALRLVGVALGVVVRPRPVLWFMSAGMLRLLSPLVAVMAWRAPVVVMTFGGWLGEMVPELPTAHRRVVVASLRRARRVCAQSERTVDQARRAGVAQAAATGVMRPWLDVHARLDADGRRPLRLAYAGRVERRKGIVALVELVRASGGRVTARIAGPVDDDPSLRAVLDGSPEGVEVVGELPPAGVLDLLREADLSVLLSTYPGEGLPGAVVESLQVGTPVIVSDHLALPELVEDGTSGFVVPVPADGTSWPVAELLARLDGLGADELTRLRAGAASAGSRHTPERWLPLLLGPLGIDVAAGRPAPVAAR